MPAGIPTRFGNQTEHVPEALDHKAVVLAAPVGRAYTAAADNVVGVVGHDLLVALHAARQIDVVHRDLRQRVVAVVAVHVGHLLVKEVHPAAVAGFYQHLVFRLVEIVGDGSLARYPWSLPLRAKRDGSSTSPVS